MNRFSHLGKYLWVVFVLMLTVEVAPRASRALTGNPAFWNLSSANGGAFRANKPDAIVKLFGDNGITVRTDPANKSLTIGIVPLVRTFNNRTGNVLPKTGDYTAAQVGLGPENAPVFAGLSITGDALIHNNDIGTGGIASNLFFGEFALGSNTTGTHNIAFGAESLSNNTTGVANTAFGEGALAYNTTGSHNLAFGWSTLSLNTTGDYNIAIGEDTGPRSPAGSHNIGIGNAAMSGLSSYATPSYNVVIGDNAGFNVSINGFTNTIAIGQDADTTGSNRVSIGNYQTTDTRLYGSVTARRFNNMSGLSASTPLMAGAPAVGTATTVARANHVHPVDTSRTALSAFNTYTGAINTRLSATEPAITPGTTAQYWRGDKTWQDLTAGTRGYDGLDGHTLTCTLSGVQTITFDANGLNPSPPMTAYIAYLYMDGNLVTPKVYEWGVSTTKTILSGSGSASNFTPSVFGIYSLSKSNNYITGFFTYSTGYNCQAVAPVAVTKIGNTGLQGLTGPAGYSGTNKSRILQVFYSTAGGRSLVLRPTSGEGDTAAQIEIQDVAGNTTFFCSGAGTCTWKSASGIVIAKIEASTGEVTNYDSLGRRTFKNMSSGVGIRKAFDIAGNTTYREVRNGAYRMYRGGAVVQERMSSGALSL